MKRDRILASSGRLRGVAAGIGLLAGALSIGIPTALAAKLGVIIVDGTPVMSTTAPNAEVIETLNQNAQVGASDDPYQGYYRVRTASGKIGWIAAGAMSMREYPRAAASSASIAAEARGSGERFPRFVVKAHGGIDFLTMSQASSVSRFPAGLTYQFGGAVGFNILSWLTVLVRAEYLLNSLLGQVSSSQSFTFLTTAVPLYGGVEFSPLNTPKFALRVGAFAGFSPVLSHSVTDTLGASSGQLLLSQPAFAIQGKVEGAFKATQWLTLFLEAGYRYLNSGLLSTTGATGTVVTAGIYSGTPIAIDLSGITLLGGVGFTF